MITEEGVREAVSRLSKVPPVNYLMLNPWAYSFLKIEVMRRNWLAEGLNWRKVKKLVRKETKAARLKTGGM